MVVGVRISVRNRIAAQERSIGRIVEARPHQHDAAASTSAESRILQVIDAIKALNLPCARGWTLPTPGRWSRAEFIKQGKEVPTGL